MIHDFTSGHCSFVAQLCIICGGAWSSGLIVDSGLTGREFDSSGASRAFIFVRKNEKIYVLVLIFLFFFFIKSEIFLFIDLPRASIFH